ncbi:hypothetical protein [Sphingobium estronivorans]|uniref:hypothetical protein n=1 Tax=Sphingobium estronivorans TaxID=1577690 RepID=UPI00123B709E|nr:hypothetical protein [Sphingobium estronivorans]
MTRPLHAETKVQRGDSPTAEQRERGYEPLDASPAKVLLGVACFLALMVAGLLFSAATLGWLKAEEDRPRNPARGLAVKPPPPHLLAEPLASRQRFDAAMAKQRDKAALDRAAQAVIQRGWQEDMPPPDATARARRGAAR